MSSVKMAESPYTVPIIASDLRHEEMIQQMCDTLAYLDAVATDIFSRISRRVTENREKLAQLNHRTAVAEAKVNRIKGLAFEEYVAVAGTLVACDVQFLMPSLNLRSALKWPPIVKHLLH